jgi:hypothetical protein
MAARKGPDVSKTWFITSAGRGFGKEFATAALSRGDKVAAAARNTESLSDLIRAHGDAIPPLTLDVTYREELFTVVEHTKEVLGYLDLVVNDAGYGLFGAVDEITPEELPILRQQGQGHIIQVSTVGGRCSDPDPGLLRVQVGPGGHGGITGPGSRRLRQGHPGGTRRPRHRLGRVQRRVSRRPASISAGQGSRLCHRRRAPKRPCARRRSAGGAESPLRIFFGTQGLQLIQPLYAQRIKAWHDSQEHLRARRGE